MHMNCIASPIVHAILETQSSSVGLAPWPMGGAHVMSIIPTTDVWYFEMAYCAEPHWRITTRSSMRKGQVFAEQKELMYHRTT